MTCQYYLLANQGNMQQYASVNGCREVYGWQRLRPLDLRAGLINDMDCRVAGLVRRFVPSISKVAMMEASLMTRDITVMVRLIMD